jgi:hypothetical protein
MSNDGTSWHSDDELASALERALEIPADSQGEPDSAQERFEPKPHTASHDFSDLFAALTEPEPVQQSEPLRDVVQKIETVEVSDAEHGRAIAMESAAPVQVAAEQVFESLDDFKPRTNFIPVITPEEAAQAANDKSDSYTQSEASASSVTSSVPVTSAHVTQPIRWDRQRPSFDEIIFGASASEVS